MSIGTKHVSTIAGDAAIGARVGYLDGLRAIAVIGVVLCHTAEIYAVPAPLNYWMVQGQHGVDLFFVLSGFCLSYPTLRRIALHGFTDFDAARFFAIRAVRIAPPYWIALALSAGALALWGAHATAHDVIRDFFFIDGGRGQHVNDAFWTIPIEMRWYIIFPLVLWLFVQKRRLFGALGLLAFISAFTAARSTDLFILPAFMLGIVAAWISIDRSVRGWFAVMASIMLLALAVHPDVEALASRLDVRNPIWYLASFSLVVACGQTRILERIASIRPLALIGLISYSIYLLHVPILMFCHYHRVSASVAVMSELLAPAIFWIAAERTFFMGRARAALVPLLRARFAIGFQRLGLPETITLRHAPLRPAGPTLAGLELSSVVPVQRNETRV